MSFSGNEINRVLNGEEPCLYLQSLSYFRKLPKAEYNKNRTACSSYFNVLHVFKVAA